jgi:uncharacterized membrane protein
MDTRLLIGAAAASPTLLSREKPASRALSKSEKCYGIAKVGQNDSLPGSNTSCGARSSPFC